MVGTYSDATGNHGFFYSQGQFTTIDVAGANRTVPVDINDAGQVVGYYNVTITNPCCANQDHAFLWSGGQLTLLPDYPGAYRTDPAGINNGGAIVGSWCCVNNDNEAGGFVYNNGGYTQINYPGTSPSCASQQGGGLCTTYPQAINDAGQIVGTYIPSSSTVEHAFLLSGGQYTTIDPTGQTCGTYQYGCTAYGISGSGTIGISLGVTYDGSARSFLLNAGKFTSFAYPGSSFTLITRMNSQGWILGSSNIAAQFLAIPPSLVDPVPDLMSKSAPTTVSGGSLQAKGLSGRVVQGVAADGVSEVIVRIPAVNVGDQFTITLFNDQSPAMQSSSAAEDGALGSPGATTFTQSQITTQAVSVTTPSGSQVPVAFAVYRAPLDFARQNPDASYKTGTCGSIASTDDQLACRSVSLQIQNQSQGTTATLPITILRPPVVMVHGLWDNWQTWNTFSPLVSGNTVDPRFSIGRVSYDYPVTGITATAPSYSARQLKNVKANSLGFAFNAPNVLGQINDWITKHFKQGTNPLGIAAVGVQADIVAHSMGGDITRTIVLQPSFVSNDTFGQGNIHKVITIDTPHLGSPLGSPLAAQLATSQEHCLDYWILANLHKFVFSSVVLPGGGLASGAVGDLSPSSLALSSISSQGSHPLPTALIAGVYNNFQSLQTSFSSNAIFLVCGYSDPLAQAIISPAGWQAIFNNQPNDAIVAQASQLNGLDSTFVFQGFVHSPGTEKLGFSGPSVLDPDSVGNPAPIAVIGLLNTPVTSSSFNSLNP